MRRMITMTGCLATAFAADAPARADAAPNQVRGTVVRFSGNDVHGYPPRNLKTKSSPGSDPENGDLIYYAPWGNFGFYYDASGIGFSRDTVNLGSHRASAKRLARLQRGSVAVRVLRSGPSSPCRA